MRDKFSPPVFGRPRSRAPRVNGRIKYESATERAWQAKSAVLTQRCRDAGLRPTRQNQRAMDDPRRESVLGMLAIRGIISERQFEAGKSYAVADHLYRVLSGMPSQHPRSASLEPVVRATSSNTDSDEMEVRARRAVDAADAAMMVAGVAACARVRAVCLDGQPARDPAKLRAGLDALADHYGI